MLGVREQVNVPLRVQDSSPKARGSVQAAHRPEGACWLAKERCWHPEQQYNSRGVCWLGEWVVNEKRCCWVWVPVSVIRMGEVEYRVN